MRSAILLSFIAAVSGVAVHQKVSYNGYKVFRIPAASEQAVAQINQVTADLGLEAWKKPHKAGAFSDIAVPPSLLETFESKLANLHPSIMHEDLGKAIADEGNFHTYAAGSANSTWFKSYHAYKDHLQFLRDLQSSYPSNSEIVTSGSSLQGNAITGIHFYGSGGKGKPAIVLHGTVHAREWIATMVTEYLGYQLLTTYNSSSEVKGFLDKYDFFIFPVVNPDGFLYTQSTDRMWRKNRQSNSGNSCAGTDINRNWPYKWDGPGSSTDPCSESYRGSSAGSSPENKALTAWLSKTKQAQGVKLYIDFHSYSQLFMSPYGYTCNSLPTKSTEFVALAKGATSAIKAVHGTSFDYGPICSTIYQAAGSSIDWTNDVLTADYSYAIELRDTGNYGFVLPASQIVPSGEEMYQGIRYLLLNMK